MRAILHDCEGPFALRAAPLALWALPFAAVALEAGGATTYSLVLLAACLPGVFPRLAPRDVEVRLGGGELRLVGGARTQRVRARDVVGASTARVSHGIALTLARRDRQTPTTLVFANDEELERAREALGIGHGGLGAVTWPLVPGAAHTSAPTARAIAAALSLAALVAAFAGSGELAGVALFFATFPAFLGVVWAALRDSSQTIELGPRGVTLRGYQQSQVPYSAISGVARTGSMFELGVHGGTLRARHRVGALAGAGIDDAELEILSAQLAACVGRAGGLGPQKPEATTRIDTLRRGHESARDWLARVDMAASLLAQPGYRGGTIRERGPLAHAARSRGLRGPPRRRRARPDARRDRARRARTCQRHRGRRARGRGPAAPPRGHLPRARSASRGARAARRTSQEAHLHGVALIAVLRRRAS